MAHGSLLELFVKLILAMTLGGVIGLERSLNNKAAGFRTMMLICMGSMLFVEIAIFMAQDAKVFGEPNVGRVIAQIVAGIGFLGAGAIMRIPEKNSGIEGLTTAASIWFVAGLGCLIGVGQYQEAAIATFCAYLVLVVFSKVEHRLVEAFRSRTKK